MPSLKTRIKVTHKCDENCWYCFMPKDSNDMSIEMFDKIFNKLKQIYSSGNYSRLKAALTGGDPFLHPNIIRMAKKFKDFGDSFSFLSIDVCTGSNLDLLSEFISLGKQYQCHVGLNENSLEDMGKIAKFLKSKDKLVFMNILLTEKNIERLDEIIDYTISNKIICRFNHLYDPRQSLDFREKLVPALERIGKRFLEVNYKYYNYLFGCLNISKKRQSYCGYGRDYYCFDTNGAVSRCQTETPVSHVDDPDLEQKIKYDVNKNWNGCFKCEDIEICQGGCPSANKFGGYCKEYQVFIPYIKELKKIQEGVKNGS